MSYARVVPPAEPVVSVPQARAHLRVSHQEDDATIAGLIEAATALVENDIGHGLVTQTWLVDDIEVVTGYGGAADVPAPLKQAILLLVGAWYAQREAVSIEQVYEVPMGVKSLLQTYRRQFV